MCDQVSEGLGFSSDSAGEQLCDLGWVTSPLRMIGLSMDKQGLMTLALLPA